ncbi:hypothetical protein [Levilactobacillus tongjiangensis]|uniref:DUF4833 domain-containing protein n=1 Tax=Levilactobacillus tongjiangensis TaxID=2486023 RepID=A0ABW1SS03_9LACO|nr:hypothetical protein [Levilactobacillus tongjiangensis]
MSIKRLLFGLAGVVLGGALLAVPAQADTLPTQYQGTWYGYISSEKSHHVRRYYFNQVTIKSNHISYDYQNTINPRFKNLKWTWGASAKASYRAKVDRKGRQIYRIFTARTDEDALGKIRLGNVKGVGIDRTALILNVGYENLYLFRQPTRSHAWGEEYEDSFDIYE